jgi:hypothetical protein
VTNPSPETPASGSRLPGVVPIGSDEETPIEPINPLVKLALQFFVIPMAIVIFCVALVFIFRWLTFENRDVGSYLSALSSGTRSSSQKEQDAMKLLQYIQESKRWQSIYDVTQQLRFNREKFLTENPDFSTKVARLFQQSSGGDRKIRQYLAQVLGLIGGKDVVTVLLTALDDNDSETVIHSMIALGQIGDPVAIPKIIEISRSNDRGLRQAAIFVLGNFNSPQALDRCLEALNDPDILVSWNAAFALARQKDARAIPVLEQFLDQNYIDQVSRNYTPTSQVTPDSGSNDHPLAMFHPERLEQYRATAVGLLGQFSNPKIEKELQNAASNDKQLKVREAAIKALQNQQK